MYLVSLVADDDDLLGVVFFETHFLKLLDRVLIQILNFDHIPLDDFNLLFNVCNSISLHSNSFSFSNNSLIRFISNSV